MCKVYILLFSAIILLGLGSLAMLPVFEGFDEPAHYSSIRQIADTGTVPVYGHGFLSGEVAGYGAYGPMPYTSGNPPFSGSKGLSYKAFADSPALQADYLRAARETSDAAPFTPSSQDNWETQHPPLYYMVMAPAMKATESLPLVTRMLLLRLVSYAMAVCGLMIALGGSLAYYNPATPARRFLPLAFLCYPLVFPMFTPEFARLGNDALCLLLSGIIWALLLRLVQEGTGTKPVALLAGTGFGLGLLTKAFFLPMLLGLALFLLWRIWERRSEGKTAARIAELALILIPAALIGGGYYWMRYHADGSAIGYEYVALAKKGGLIAALEGHFPVFMFLRGTAAVFATWVWTGTWSLTRMPEIAILPLLALCAWLLLNYLREAWRHPPGDPVWLPVWLMAPLLGGLISHVLVMIAVYGTGVGAGWYLHILAPATACMLAAGCVPIMRSVIQRRIFKGLLCYGVGFTLAASWAQWTLFAGCSVKGDDKYYRFSGSFACLGRIPEVMAHLSVLGWPVLSALLLTGGACCALAAIAALPADDKQS